MAASRVKRQVLLFLLGVLIPGVVLLGFGLMLIRQESELSQRRTADLLSIRARTLADSVEAWLETGFVAISDSLQAGVTTRYPARNPIIRLGTFSDGVYADATSRLPDPHPLAQTAHSNFIRAVQRQEFGRSDVPGAIRSLRTRISSENDSTRLTDLRIRLARALFASNELTLGIAQAGYALRKGVETVDIFGTPLALYAADMLLENGEQGEICDQLRPIADTIQWITAAAAEYLLDLAGRAECPADVSLTDLVAETHLARHVLELGDRLITDRTGERWAVVGENWLVRRVDGDRREAEAVVAVRLDRIADWLEDSGVDSLRLAHTPPLLSERDRILAPTFPRLVATFPPAIQPLVSRASVFGFAVLLVLLITVVGGYLLWRDLRQESKLLNLQSQFVASVSHELRTPLTSIRLFSEAMLEYGATDAEEREKGLRVIAHESGRLSRMLNNVLSTTRVERGTMTYQMAPGDLADAAENAIEAMRREYDEAGMTVERELDMARADFDPDTIEQAVLNLLSNALKYASSGGRVLVKSWEEAGHASISVQDFGSGIEPKEQNRVFERFYRISGNGQSRMPGAGLGLALIKHIAIGHGGTILLDSKPGAGCHFTIQLPLYA